MAPDFQRGTAPDDTRSAKPIRPPIWAEGRQRPKFDLMAFARVSDDIARRDLAPVIRTCANRLAGFGQHVLAGKLRVTAPWAQRILPSHKRVGAGIMGFQRLLAGSAALIAPEEPVEPLAYANLTRAPEPAPTLSPQAAKAEPTLQAIRSAIRDVSAPLPHHPAVTEPVTQAASRQGPLQLAASWVMLRAMMLVALPVGAVKAALFHLDGGDLRDWS